MTRQNPFTTTFSKIPDYTYIPTEQEREIIDNFNFDNPSESLYKITGVRGSGKTVLLAKIEEEFGDDEHKTDGWVVYRLTTTRDMLRQLAASLYKDGFVSDKYKNKSINLSANILGTGGGIGLSRSEKDEFFDIGTELDSMLQKVEDKKKKVLIGVDEISRTPEMVVFASEFGKWMRAGYPIYMVCTGLYENIEQLYNVKNLTFFRRATTVKTEPLNMIRMTEMYKSKLGVASEKAKSMARITKGYPYAFQELGVLYFKKRENEELQDIEESLKVELFSYSYEKIWEELSNEDRKLVLLLVDKEEYKRDEILAAMDKPDNYSTYRDRLLKRGIITSRRGYISLALPYFAEYVKEYCMD